MPSPGFDMNEGSLVIPKWFLAVSSVVATCICLLVIPWAIWVTSMLFSIDARTGSVAAMFVKIDTLSERVSKLEGKILSRYDGRSGGRDRISSNSGLALPASATSAKLKD